MGIMLQAIRHWFRKRRYRVGRTITRFVAMDVKREVRIVDVRRLDEGFITAQIRTTNVLYRTAGLVPEAEFEPPIETPIVNLWRWTGQSCGGLPDGTSLVGTHLTSKTDS